MAGKKRSGEYLRVRETPQKGYAAPGKGRLIGVVLDTDIIIEILRGRVSVTNMARNLERSGVPTYCTPIAWAEVYSGIRAGEEHLTQAFFEARQELVLDAPVGQRAGSYLARYARSHGVEIADALVAAATVISGLRLWTLNSKHYPMPDVRFFKG